MLQKLHLSAECPVIYPLIDQIQFTISSEPLFSGFSALGFEFFNSDSVHFGNAVSDLLWPTAIADFHK